MSRDPKSNYYDAGGIETLDIIKAKLTPEQYRGYLLGNIIKYSCRINHKHDNDTGKSRDVDKIQHYSKELIKLFDSSLRYKVGKFNDNDGLNYYQWFVSDFESPIIICQTEAEAIAKCAELNAKR